MRLVYSVLTLLCICLMSGCLSESEREAIRLMDRAESLLQSDPHGAYEVLDSIPFPDELHDKNLSRWCLMMIHLSDTINTRFPYLPQVKRMCNYVQKNGTTKEQVRALLHLGKCYSDNLDFEQAMITYSEAFVKSSESKNWGQAGYVVSHMGDVYQFQELYFEAIQKYLQAAVFFQKAGNFRSQAIAWVEASRNYVLSDSLDIALAYMHRADSLISIYGDSTDMAVVFNGLGNIYKAQKEYSLAELYYKKSIAYDSQESAPDNLALADLFLLQGNLEKARYYHILANVPSENPETPLEWLYQSYQIEQKAGNVTVALSCLEQYIEATDSIMVIKQNVNIQGKEDLYKYNRILTNNQLLKIRQKDQMVIFLFVAFSFVLSIILILLRLKSRNLDLIRKEKEILNLKNHLYEVECDLNTLSKELESHKEQIDIQKGQLSKRVEDLYQQKIEEIEIIRKQIQERNWDLLESSAITRKVKKLSQKLIPNANESPLTEKDWNAIWELINMVYPAVSKAVLKYELNDKERTVCYLTLFNLNTNQEAVLMNQPISSINKYRQTLRKKLHINNRNVDLYDFLVNLKLLD